jgi:4-diphosphocytidyl-2-C-methyl-D-erythritol kinase
VSVAGPTFATRPPAKLNLTLEVGPPQADGFHPLCSVFVRIGLADVLVLTPADGSVDSLSVTGLPGCPVAGNLALHALELLRRRSGAVLPPLALQLDKRIPIAAGLAGGSSDGAAALELAAAAWGLGLADDDRLRLALELGSDAPFFSSGAAAALVEGRGERLAPLPVPAAAGVLLYFPAFGISTASSFSLYDQLAPRSFGGRETDGLAAALRGGLDGTGLAGWAERLRDSNHLWPAAVALQPSLASIRAQLEAATGTAWLMTGSGPTLFSLHPTAGEARMAGERLAGSGGGLLTKGTLLAATDLIGPDPVWRYE